MKKLLFILLIAGQAMCANYFIKTNSIILIDEVTAIQNDGTTNMLSDNFSTGGADLTTVSNQFLLKDGDTANTLTVTNLTYLYDNHLHATNPVGNYAFSAGYGIASGDRAISIGGMNPIISEITGLTTGYASAIASADGSVSIGFGRTSLFDPLTPTYYYHESQATAPYSMALMGGKASAISAISIGKSSVASGESSFSIQGGYATNYHSVSFGGNAFATSSIAFYGSTASGQNSCALLGGIASGKDSFCVTGNGGNNAIGERSVALGGIAKGNASFATADGNANGEYSVAMADGIVNTGSFGHVNGNGDAIQDGNASIAMAGGQTFGRKCFAVSGLMVANQTNQELSGYAKSTVASNDYTIAMGMGSQATNLFSMALMGGTTIISNSIAIGVNTYMGDNQIKDLADGVSANDAVNVSQLQGITNGTLQSADEIAIAGDIGVLVSPDSSGSNSYFSTTVPELTITNLTVTDDLTSLGSITATNGITLSRHAITTTTTNYVVSLADDYILCNGTLTNTLPTAQAGTNQVVHVKNTGSGTIYIDGNGTNIDGSAMITLPATYDAVDLVSDGNTWHLF